LLALLQFSVFIRHSESLSGRGLTASRPSIDYRTLVGAPAAKPASVVAALALTPEADMERYIVYADAGRDEVVVRSAASTAGGSRGMCLVRFRFRLDDQAVVVESKALPSPIIGLVPGLLLMTAGFVVQGAFTLLLVPIFLALVVGGVNAALGFTYLRESATEVQNLLKRELEALR
jgi:hypothetical protein